MQPKDTAVPCLLLAPSLAVACRPLREHLKLQSACTNQTENPIRDLSSPNLETTLIPAFPLAWFAAKRRSAAGSAFLGLATVPSCPTWAWICHGDDEDDDDDDDDDDDFANGDDVTKLDDNRNL